jgi:ABC-type nitrate/sulfonate/bicarbonate transport system substrate-binding protein
VEMIWNNDLLAMVQSFETGQIDILSHIKPYTTRMIVEKGATAITSNAEVWGEGSPNCTLAIMDDFGKKYPNTVKGFLRALNKGYELLVADPEKSVELLTKGGYYKVDSNVLLYALKNQPKKVLLTPDEKSIMLAINDMVSAKYIDAPKTSIIDLSFLESINK